VESLVTLSGIRSDTRFELPVARLAALSPAQSGPRSSQLLFIKSRQNYVLLGRQTPLSLSAPHARLAASAASALGVPKSRSAVVSNRGKRGSR